MLALFSFIAFVCTLIYEMIGDLWSSVCSIVHIASTTEATVTTTYEVSMWRSLWNDLFSKVLICQTSCFTAQFDFSDSPLSSGFDKSYLSSLF